MAKICNGNHKNKSYYHEHRCECACGCKVDTQGYANCAFCSFEHGAQRTKAKHALSFYERDYGRGAVCDHPQDRRMFGDLCGLCNKTVIQHACQDSTCYPVDSCPYKGEAFSK